MPRERRLVLGNERSFARVQLINNDIFEFLPTRDLFTSFRFKSKEKRNGTFPYWSAGFRSHGKFMRKENERKRISSL